MKDAAKAIDFYQRAFGVTEKFASASERARRPRRPTSAGPPDALRRSRNTGSGPSARRHHATIPAVTTPTLILAAAGAWSRPACTSSRRALGTCAIPSPRVEHRHEIEKVTTAEMQRRYDAMLKDA
jgi:hypothetical protein